MDQQIVIRRCTVADAPALSALAMRTFEHTFTGTCTEEDMAHFLSHYYNVAQMSKELSDPADHIFFAMHQDQPIGYIRFGENEVPFDYDRSLKPLELNRLYIDASFKGMGVARQLMDLYESFAAEHGYQMLWLGVWEHNQRAQAFYRKYGFTFTGHTHPFPVGNTPQTDEWWAKVIS